MPLTASAASAARRPPHDTDPVARWMLEVLGVLAKTEPQGMTWESSLVNGEQGGLFMMGGHPVGALTCDLNGGRIRRITQHLPPHYAA